MCGVVESGTKAKKVGTRKQNQKWGNGTQAGTLITKTTPTLKTRQGGGHFRGGKGCAMGEGKRKTFGS